MPVYLADVGGEVTDEVRAVLMGAAADRALDGLLDYAEGTRAENIVYHAANLVMLDGGRAAAGTRERALREEDALAARAGRLEHQGRRSDMRAPGRGRAQSLRAGATRWLARTALRHRA